MVYDNFDGPGSTGQLVFRNDGFHTVTLDNASLEIDFDAIEANFSTSFVADMDFQGNSVLSVDVSSGMQSVELFLLELDLTGTWDLSEDGTTIDQGDAVGLFEGQLIGETAGGAIVTFDVDQLDGNEDIIESFLGVMYLSPDVP